MNLQGFHILVCGATHPFGPSLPNVLSWDLVNVLRKSGAHVTELYIPFHPLSEDSVINQMVAWSLLDFGEARNSAYDLVIATSFPSYGIKCRHKSVWYCSDFPLTLRDYGIDSPLFYRSPENEKKRFLVNRMVADGLNQAEELYFLTEALAEDASQFLEIEADVLPPPIEIDYQFHPVIPEYASKQSHVGVLLIDRDSHDYGAKLLEQMFLFQVFREILIIGDASQKLPFLGMVDRQKGDISVTFIELMDEPGWQYILHSSPFFCDCRSLRAFDPVAWAAQTRRHPYFYRGKGNEDFSGGHYFSAACSLSEDERAAGELIEGFLKKASPEVERSNKSGQSSDWNTIISHLCRPLLGEER